MTPSLATSPLISDWVSVDPDGTISARTGKAEIGQGIATALLDIVATGLRVPRERVRLSAPSTDHSPDEGFTAGSLSIQQSGTALDLAARAALALFAQAASSALGSPIEAVADGAFVVGGRHISYGDLAGSVDLGTTVEGVDAEGLLAEHAPDLATGGPGGKAGPRRDLPAKILGEPAFLQDVRLPGMRFGRMVRPPFRGARLAGAPAPDGLPGDAEVVVDGSVVGVIASREYDAITAAEIVRIRCQWTGEAVALDDGHMASFLLSAPTEDTDLAVSDQGYGAQPHPTGAAMTALYTRPFLSHASIGTACAIARHDDRGVEIWSHTQGVYPLRRDIARALGWDEDRVTVHHVEGAGCYGHNPADDAAYDAVILARAVPGTAVQVTWSRADELGWAPFGPAMAVRISAETDEAGQVVSWQWDGYGNGHSSRPSTLTSPSLLAYADQEGGRPIPPSNDPPLASGAGTGRNGIPGYRVGALRATSHRLLDMPIRASAMRSLGAHMNVFAIESHMDDLARAHGVDPVEYRLRHLDDPRARAVIETVATMAGWGSATGPDHGRGIGYARYKNTGAWCAVVAQVEAVSEVRVEHLWIAVDCGRVVSLDGVVNQIEGGALQSLSWTLLEKVRFVDGAITSIDWESYPILRFTGAPPVSTRVLDRPEQPWVGAGEASSGPTAAALANALHDAVGVRVRDLPITPERIVAALGD